MSDGNVIVAVDIGAGDIKALVCNYDEQQKRVKVLGYHKRNSLHVDNKGIINDVNSLSFILTDAVKEACNMAGVNCPYVVANIPATDINLYHSAGPITIGQEKGSPGQIQVEHIEKAIETAKNIRIPADHEIIDFLVEEYLIDNVKSVKNPLDMTANRLDINLLIISSLSSTIMDVQNCIHKADFICEGILLTPVASGSVAVSDFARERGTLHIDIGAALTTFSVYQNGALIHIDTEPMGGKLITSDLLFAFMAPSNFYNMSAVDALKKKNSSLFISNPSEKVTLRGPSGKPDSHLTKEQFVTVMADRLYEIFDEVAKKLEQNDLFDDIKEVILTGGTAKIKGIEELCKKRFKKPVSVGLPMIPEEDMMSEINSPEYVTAYGLAHYYYNEELYKPFSGYSGSKKGALSGIMNHLKKIFIRRG